jgi:hypothetical protein
MLVASFSGKAGLIRISPLATHIARGEGRTPARMAAAL